MNEPLAFRAMNTDFLVAGLSGDEAAAVRRQVTAAETAFSRFLPESELSRINEAGGEWVEISNLTFDLLAVALQTYRETDGVFDPFLGVELLQAGYDRSFELLEPVLPKRKISQPRQTDADDWAAKASVRNPAPLELAEQNSRVRLASGFALDLGGIAKGWTAQRAANGLLAAGSPGGLIDAGGDVVLWGREPEQGLWGVGVGHPQGKEQDVADFWLEGLTAMATSSVVKRCWQKPGQEAAHHIIDPHTGRSADTDFLQATVLARDLTEAEGYAKCLIVLGSQAGSAWIVDRRPDLAWLGVRRDGRVLHSDNLQRYAKEWEVRPHVKLD